MKVKEADSGERGEESPVSGEMNSVIGANLRQLRQTRGLSLEKLGKAAGVSRAMLSQIELGQSAPTINLLWKIAQALGMPISAFLGKEEQRTSVVLRAAQAKLLTNADGSFVSRALFPFDGPRSIEFYELRLAPRAVEKAEAHEAGTRENLVVSQGTVEIETLEQCQRLEQGDAMIFDADLPHSYINPGDTQAVLFLVVAYAQKIN